MATATIELELSDYIMHKQEWETGTELVYGTCINALIYDDNYKVIASDNYYSEYTSNVFLQKNGKTLINREDTDEQIIKRYLTTIKYVFKNITAYKGDSRKHWLDMWNSEMDREDIEYNQDLWEQYKPLYDLLQAKGLELDLN